MPGTVVADETGRPSQAGAEDAARFGPDPLRSFGERVQTQLIFAWDLLATMMSTDAVSFHSFLSKPSGFQSFQTRLLEFRLSAKDPKMMRPHRHMPDWHALLEAALQVPSIYNAFIAMLRQHGLVPVGRVGGTLLLPTARPQPRAAGNLAADLPRTRRQLRAVSSPRN